MHIIRRLSAACALVILISTRVPALVVPLGQADIERALSVGRAFDPERARFHRPYVIALNDATVEQIEVVTEFRRVVLFAEERIRRGDHMFGLRQTEEALRSWRGRLTIIARLRFHPLNTYVMAPLFDMAIGPSPLRPLDVRRTTLYAQLGPHQRLGTPAPLTGAIIEADFDAASVGQAEQVVRVVLDEKDVARTTIPFARLE